MEYLHRRRSAIYETVRTKATMAGGSQPMRHVVPDSKRLTRSAKFAIDVTAATVAQIAVRRHLIDRATTARPIPLSVPNIVAALIAGHSYRHRLVKRTPSETMIKRPMRNMGASPND